MPASPRVTRLRERVAAVPGVGPVLGEWRRVEVVDRAMVIAAQGLLALVPLVVVVVAFLPADLTRAALDRFVDITGLADDSLARTLSAVRPDAAIEDVRAQIGVVGALVTVLSASSFARALMRSYERTWDVRPVSGLEGRRRALGWLLLWLSALEVLGLVARLLGRAGAPIPVAVVVQAALTSLLWWWTLRVLLSRRLSWSALVVPAVVSGVALQAFVRASSLVMPTYSRESVRQFGAFGLVLALASWLVAVSAVLVVAAILGRAAEEWRGRHRVDRRPEREAPRPPPELRRGRR